MAKTDVQVAVPRKGHRGGDPAASVYRASFTKVLFSTLYSMAMSNVLIFMLGASAAFIGLASALNAIAYFAGPILFHGVSKRAGIKCTLVTISIIDVAMLLVAASFPLPGVIIVIFIVDGFVDCIFWANMVAAVRACQETVPVKSRDVIYRRYSISWVVAGLASELLGIAIIFAGFDDRVVLAISIAIAFVQVPVSYFVFVPPQAISAPDGDPALRTRRTTTSVPRETAPGDGTGGLAAKLRSIGNLLAGPLFLIVVAELSIQMIRGTYDFLYPFVVRDDDGSTGWIYVMSIAQRFAFMVGIYASSKQGSGGQLVGAITGLGIATALTVGVVGHPGPIMFSIALALTSIATGLIYGYSSQALLRCSKRGNALRLAALYETVSGLGYGITVVIAGLGGEHDTRPMFVGLIAFLALAFALFILAASRRIGNIPCLAGTMARPRVVASGRSILVRFADIRRTPDVNTSGLANCAMPLMDTAKK
ncbi:MAG: MFS transporter [Candidatus Lokiarchaeota archaeon]|nr:MFS transporter [Candidatus Lokiarchaeota archaeon]